VWGVAAGLFLALLLASLPSFLAERAQRERSFREQCLAALAAIRETDGVRGRAGRKVIAIGSSLIYCGTFQGEQMTAFAMRERLEPIRYLCLARSYGEADAFVPLLPAIADAAPDLLLVESEALQYRWDQNGLSGAMRDHAAFFRRWLKAALARISGRRPEPPREPSSPFIREAIDAKGAMSTAGEQLAQLDAHHRPQGPFRPGDPLVAALASLRARGVRIVVVETPRPAAARQALSDDEIRRAEARLRHLERACGASVLRFDRQLGPGAFLDFAHLAPEGRAEYSRWLLSRLPGAARAGQVIR
jgi:hypothetical protein